MVFAMNYNQHPQDHIASYAPRVARPPSPVLSVFDKRAPPMCMPASKPTSKMTQLLASPPTAQHTPHQQYYQPPAARSPMLATPTQQQQQQQANANITFCCPKPHRQGMFSKSRAYLHTPPPVVLGHTNPLSFDDSEEEEDDDEDERDYNSSDDDDEVDDDDDDNDDGDERESERLRRKSAALRASQREFRDEGVFASD